MEQTTDIDEQTLIARITAYIRSGDHRAAATEFAHIVRRYSQQILDFATRMITNREDAEDVAQNVFVKAFRKFDTFQGRAAFSTWLTRIAYNESINIIKSRKHNNLDYTSIDDCEISDDELSTGNEERIQLLEQAIDLLPPDEKMLVHLYYYEDKPIKEIAYVMDSDANTLGVRLHRIRKKLAKTIDTGVQNTK